jgi:membrane protein YqaA with SNARE-associated domain
MIAGLAGALSIIGTIASTAGSFMQYSASKKAEEIRRKQMKLEADRQRREQIRRAQVSRAKAVAAATNQGAGESSALLGGIAQTQNEASRNIVSINQDERAANRIFDYNAQAATGSMISALGSGISSLGGAVSSNAGTITRLGAGGGFGFGNNEDRNKVGLF